VRLREYHEKTNPVLDIFRRKEYVITVDATASKEAVQQEIRSKLALPAFVPRASAAGVAGGR
jgi:adenylate kinase